MDRTFWIAFGLFLLGAILLGAGWAITGPASVTNPPVNVGGQSAIALGLSFMVVGVGLFLAWAAPRHS